MNSKHSIIHSDNEKLSIINELAKQKVVEKTLSNLGVSSPYCKDLSQDIYIELLNKPDDLIVGLYERNEHMYYIVRMVKNNVNSLTSPYYKNYEKFRKTTEEINEKTKNFNNQ